MLSGFWASAGACNGRAAPGLCSDRQGRQYRSYNSLVGRGIERLERGFAAEYAAAGVVATGFGRSAMWLALEAAGARGGNVLVPNFICAQVPEVVRRAGACPVFFPVRRDLEVRTEDVAVAFTATTRAAVVAHYYGRTQPQSDALRALCDARGVTLIEDCALALGARRGDCRAGTCGHLAVFSFTKSDWCYGGGLVAAYSEELRRRLREHAREKLWRARWLCWWYGVLRRADFVANRPARSRLAEQVGRWVERASGLSPGNFYDAGRFDAALPTFAARRARRLLANLQEDTARRQTILRQLCSSLADAPEVLFRPQADPGDAGSFLLVRCREGAAEDRVGQAARNAVTLRRCWPAYQNVEDGQASEDLTWLARHLLLLEIHPRLSVREVERIAKTLRRLAGSVNG